MSDATGLYYGAKAVKTGEVTFLSGELRLEGVVSVPEGSGPFPAVIVCHPHPLYGGSMDNNVVDSLCRAINEASLISFKFNFRGVGQSQGRYGHGAGEQEDVSAAIAYVTGVAGVDAEKLGLAGYSAGAGFALPVGVRDGRVKALAAVSPPLSMFDFSPLSDCSKPKLLILGSNDDLVPASRFEQFCRGLPEPREYVTVDGADHFWQGFEAGLASKVSAFFARALAGEV